MKPFDSRLIRHARGIVTPLIAGGALGVLRAGALVAWAWSIAHLIVWVVAPVMDFDWAVIDTGEVLEGFTPQPVPMIVLALGAVALRFVTTWLMGVVSERGAVIAKQQLRRAAVTRVRQLGPAWQSEANQAKTTLTLGRGLDALDEYFAQYLPQLMLTVTVTPLLTLALWIAHPLSALIVVIVFPLIPVFMVLIGLATQGAQDRQWRALGSLSHAYLDLIRGLPTLKLFRREYRQPERVRTLTNEYRTRTMHVLRVTFLSGFVLDLAGTFSVALVAVTVGTKLVAGEFALTTALFVLLLVPDIFVPIRQVGAAFHASAEGLTAANDVFEILETPIPRSNTVIDRDSGPLLRLTNAAPVGRGNAEAVTAHVHPGEVVALAGPSGVGKTSLLNAVIGVNNFSGQIERQRFVWAGQHPGLTRGSVTENIALGDPHPNPTLVTTALRQACVREVSPDTQLGVRGTGVSGGQAQRLAFARALYRAHRTGAKLVLLDEPTSALDADTEASVLASITELAADGFGVLLVSHRSSVLQAADRVIHLRERTEQRV